MFKDHSESHSFACYFDVQIRCVLLSYFLDCCICKQAMGAVEYFHNKNSYNHFHIILFQYVKLINRTAKNVIQLVCNGPWWGVIQGNQ